MEERLASKILPELNFKGKWRFYQKRVLEELKNHLNDKKLNVVAAPGAGKTTLGIEVLRRLEKPALILTPTITIKNQWRQRIIEGFLSHLNCEEFISSDIQNIQTITVTTYQALHSVFKNKEKKEKFLADLIEKNIKTLVLDEAHHLRTEWWHTLNELCLELEGSDFTTVSLTGTPPYDVSVKEWNNYHELCGTVDAEISIPELVKNGDLCPHQDLIYFSNLNNEEQKVVFDFKENRRLFFEYLNKDSEFLYAITASDFLNNLDKNAELIYENVDFTVALISYLLHNDSLDINARLLTEFLGLVLENIPPFNYEIAETLFNGILGQYEQYFKNIISVKNKLKELKLLQTSKKVDFTGDFNFKQVFARSQNKLQSIKDITNIEYSALGNSLREVVLLDYIGKGDGFGVNILSVFGELKSKKFKIGILTGSLVVIPEDAKELLYKVLAQLEIDAKNVLTNEFEEGYLRVEVFGDTNIVSAITAVFYEGGVNILIGTQALLGEGWDSPCVNSLIIASTVSSFMLSNQMRGRALRVDKNNLDKTSNIWHLVSLADGQTQDFEAVKRRFNTFEGISYIDNVIQSGEERLGLDDDDIFAIRCNKLNEIMKQRAFDRNFLKEKWKQIFDKSEITEKKSAPHMYEVIENSKPQLPAICLENQENWFFKKIFNPILLTFKVVREKQKKTKIAERFLEALCKMRLISTPYYALQLQTVVSKDKNSYITLLNCTNYERNLFINCFNEFFAPAQNQRYILKKEDKYYVVPEIIGVHKKNVETFVQYLKLELGYLDIIFTRTPQNRAELLKARYGLQEGAGIKKTRIWL